MEDEKGYKHQLITFPSQSSLHDFQCADIEIKPQVTENCTRIALSSDKDISISAKLTTEHQKCNNPKRIKPYVILKLKKHKRESLTSTSFVTI